MSYRAKTRSLLAGEAVPDGEPKRYKSDHGYIRLRWLVGVGEYVEVYEHRVVEGRVTEAEHVHHKNKDRSDNRPENLEYLTEAEHMAHHASEIRAQGKWYPYKCRDSAMKAAIADNNRWDRARRLELILNLRTQGLSTTKIGQIVGLDASGVSRYLNHGRNP